MSPDLIEVAVSARRVAAQDVVDLELKSTDGSPLPSVGPGAHIDLHLPGGMIRQYSIHASEGDPRRYRIGVGLAETSRGGSRYVHASLQIGERLPISQPRNNFPLSDGAARYFFIAGGIGITPILSMVRWCERNDRNWTLLYCVRSRSRAAYIEHLPGAGRVILHVDDETGTRPDLAGFLAAASTGDQVYCCGPGPLMDAVARSSALLPADAVHFERFTAEPQPEGGNVFTLRLRQSGLELPVASDVSVLEALEAAGIEVPFSCREGLCRTCECRVLAGEVDHRDYVLSDEERESNEVMMICCSRAKSSVIELDL